MRPLTYRNLMRFCLAILFGIALWIPAATARADIGPKPGMQFTFEFQVRSVPITAGKLLECSDSTCADAQPLRQMGPQRFECTTDTCTSMAYGYAPYHKLVITFSDKTRESNVFTKQRFDATYVVTVQDDALSVHEVSRPDATRLLAFLFSLPFTLLIELGLAVIYLLVSKLPLRILVWVCAANLLSLPIVWFVFPLISTEAIFTTGFAEIFAVGFEALVIYIIEWSKLSPLHAIALSLLTNLASFLVGLFIGSAIGIGV